MTSPPAPLQPARLNASESIPVVVDDMGRYAAAGDTLIEEGVCRDCGRLLYRATPPDAPVDVWHPHTVLAGEPTTRFDGVLVTSQPGECAGATVGVGRPDPSAFVIGIPLVPVDWLDGSAGLPCYICGAEDNHATGADPYDVFDCPSELTRAAADELRHLVGLADVDHERRRDDRV